VPSGRRGGPACADRTAPGGNSQPGTPVKPRAARDRGGGIGCRQRPAHPRRFRRGYGRSALQPGQRLGVSRLRHVRRLGARAVRPGDGQSSAGDPPGPLTQRQQPRWVQRHRT
jgi:hypothetical protein